MGAGVLMIVGTSGTCSLCFLKLLFATRCDSSREPLSLKSGGVFIRGILVWRILGWGILGQGITHMPDKSLAVRKAATSWINRKHGSGKKRRRKKKKKKAWEGGHLSHRLYPACSSRGSLCLTTAFDIASSCLLAIAAP